MLPEPAEDIRDVRTRNLSAKVNLALAELPDLTGSVTGSSVSCG